MDAALIPIFVAVVVLIAIVVVIVTVMNGRRGAT